MTRFQTIEQDAMTLSVSDRARLASTLLKTLAPVLHDEDDGYAEALRRREKLTQNPGTAKTWEEIKAEIKFKK